MSENMNKWVISDFQNFYRIFLIGQVKLLYVNFCPINIVLSECPNALAFILKSINPHISIL
jgi:hypothetical protein